MKRIICGFLISIMILSNGCMQKKVYNHSVRDYMVYNMESLPMDLLMLNSSSIRQQDLILALFEGLVSTDSEGNIVPALASNWQISGDGLTYIFKIRENAKWSDGSRITAEDFEDFFSRILKEEDSSYTNELECIFGARNYADKKVDFDQVAIRAIEDNSLEIRLNYPCGYFLEMISSPVFSLKQNFYNLRHWGKEYKKIKYSGPFIIDNIYENGEISLKRNERYWDSEKVPGSRIHVRSEKAGAFALANYKSNDIDMLVSSITEFKDLENDEIIIKGPMAEGVSLNFNLGKDRITSNLSFRKAVNLAVDREKIEHELNGILEKAPSYVPHNIKGIDSEGNAVSVINENKSLEELLSISKYDGEKLTLLYLNTQDNNKIIADSITESLEKVKIKVLSKGYNEEELKEIIYSGGYDMLLANYTGEYDSPEAFLERWLSHSSNNINGYKDSKFDSYLYEARLSKEIGEAAKSFKDAERILIEDMPCIPLGFYNTVLLKKPYVDGVEINKRGNIILKKAYTKPKT